MSRSKYRAGRPRRRQVLREWEPMESRRLLDGSLGSALISVGDASQIEGDAGTTALTFTINVEHAGGGLTIGVDYEIVAGTATEGVDYTVRGASSGHLLYLPTQPSQTVTVDILGDLLYERDEVLFIRLSNPVSGSITDGEGIGTIVNDDTAPALSIGDASLAEGDDGTSEMVFTVTLDRPSGLTTTVNYATSDLTAVVGSDYGFQQGQLDILPGQTSREIRIPILGDLVHEPDETFALDLSDNTNSTIARSRGIGTILNDDPLPRITIAPASVLEGDEGTRLAAFTVTLDRPSITPVTVAYQTQGGTATPGEDFTPQSGVLEFLPGVTEAVITVPILGDLLHEADETFQAILSDPNGAEISPVSGGGEGGGGEGGGDGSGDGFALAQVPGEATGTILNDDPPPNVSIVGLTVIEGDSESIVALKVRLDAPSALVASVLVTPLSGTATAGVDFEAAEERITFEPGQVERDYLIRVLGDAVSEADESFTFGLSDPEGSTVAGDPAVLTITDDDPGGRLGLGANLRARERDGRVEVRVVRSDGTAGGVSVHYATAGGTARPGLDFEPTSGVLAFGPGELVKSFFVRLKRDQIYEGLETIGIQLSDPQGGATLGPDATIVLFVIDDNSLTVVNTRDSGPGSLREAILTANATPGPNTISFAIPGRGKHVIVPRSALPALRDRVTIDGTTQPGYRGLPLVTVDGRAAGNVNGLTIRADRSAVAGLEIRNFRGAGLLIDRADDVVIAGNDLRRNRQDGVLVRASQGAFIGTTVDLVVPASVSTAQLPTEAETPLAPGNWIAANGGYGIRILAGARHVISGNRVGTTLAGRSAAPNLRGGIRLDNVRRTLVGGVDPGAGNLISGNRGSGLTLSGTENLIVGNFIGVDTTGTRAVGNAANGITFQGVTRTVVAANVISGNRISGIEIDGGSRNTLLGNRIGTDAAGRRAIGNRFDGVFVDNSSHNIIGATGPGEGNLISGNGNVGIQLFGPRSTRNVVQANRIGTDLAGLEPLGNGRDGIFINEAPANRIGGLGRGEGNLVADSANVGIQLLGPSATGNIIEGNQVGTDAQGRPRLGNNFGIASMIAPNNVIRGNLVEGNVVNDYTEPGDLGVTVTSVRSTTVAGGRRGLVIVFSRPLNARKATDVSLYRLVSAGADGRFGTADDRTIAVESATYDSARRSVRLIPSVSLGSSAVRLTIDGSPRSGLRDATGNLLDGDGDTFAGGDFSTIVAAESAVARRRTAIPRGPLSFRS